MSRTIDRRWRRRIDLQIWFRPFFLIFIPFSFPHCVFGLYHWPLRSLAKSLADVYAMQSYNSPDDPILFVSPLRILLVWSSETSVHRTIHLSSFLLTRIDPMARSIALLAFFILVSIGIHALVVPKNPRHDDLYRSKRPFQGVEVNGLFNPIERWLSTSWMS
jgi:hypothetical protein